MRSVRSLLITFVIALISTYILTVQGGGEESEPVFTALCPSIQGAQILQNHLFEGTGSLRSPGLYFMNVMEDQPLFDGVIWGWGSADPRGIKYVFEQGGLLSATNRPYIAVARLEGLAWEDDDVDFEAAAVDLHGERVPSDPRPSWEAASLYRHNPLHPAMREHLKAQFRKLIDAGAEGVMLDDFGMSLVALFKEGMAFDNWTMSSFREYLSSQHDSSALADLGVEDIESFRLDSWIIDNGLSETWNTYPLSQLVQEFIRFLYGEARETILEYSEFAKNYARSSNDSDFLLTVNSGPHRGGTLGLIDDVVDFFTLEVFYNRGDHGDFYIPLVHAMDAQKPATILMEVSDTTSVPDGTAVCVDDLLEWQLSNVLCHGGVPVLEGGQIKRVSSSEVNDGYNLSPLRYPAGLYNNWSVYFGNHRALFSGQPVDSEIAVLMDFSSLFSEVLVEDGNWWVHELRQADSFLRGTGYPFDYIYVPNPLFSERKIGLDDLSQFRVLVCPNSLAMPSYLQELVLEFVRKGGILVATEDTAAFDEHLEPTTQLRSLYNQEEVVGYGLGEIHYFQSGIMDHFEELGGMASATTRQIFGGGDLPLIEASEENLLLSCFALDSGSLVVHVTNDDYSYAQDTLREREMIAVSIARARLSDDLCQNAMVYSPDFGGFYSVQIINEGDRIRIELPPFSSHVSVVLGSDDASPEPEARTADCLEGEELTLVADSSNMSGQPVIWYVDGHVVSSQVLETPTIALVFEGEGAHQIECVSAWDSRTKVSWDVKVKNVPGFEPGEQQELDLVDKCPAPIVTEALLRHSRIDSFDRVILNDLTDADAVGSWQSPSCLGCRVELVPSSSTESYARMACECYDQWYATFQFDTPVYAANLAGIEVTLWTDAEPMLEIMILCSTESGESAFFCYPGLKFQLTTTPTVYRIPFAWFLPYPPMTGVGIPQEYLYSIERILLCADAGDYRVLNFDDLFWLTADPTASTTRPVLGNLPLDSIPTLAEEFLTNDTGQTVYGVTVTFAESVTLTGFGDTLMTVDPAGEAATFTFSGADLESWGCHWLNWEPASAQLLSYEWLLPGSQTNDADFGQEGNVPGAVTGFPSGGCWHSAALYLGQSEFSPLGLETLREFTGVRQILDVDTSYDIKWTFNSPMSTEDVVGVRLSMRSDDEVWVQFGITSIAPELIGIINEDGSQDHELPHLLHVTDDIGVYYIPFASLELASWVLDRAPLAAPQLGTDGVFELWMHIEGADGFLDILSLDFYSDTPFASIYLDREDVGNLGAPPSDLAQVVVELEVAASVVVTVDLPDGCSMELTQGDLDAGCYTFSLAPIVGDCLLSQVKDKPFVFRLHAVSATIGVADVSTEGSIVGVDEALADIRAAQEAAKPQGSGIRVRLTQGDVMIPQSQAFYVAGGCNLASLPCSPLSLGSRAGTTFTLYVDGQRAPSRQYTSYYTWGACTSWLSGEISEFPPYSLSVGEHTLRGEWRGLGLSLDREITLTITK